MPSPRPHRSLSLRSWDGKDWRPKRKGAADMPPRAKQLVELMVYGDPEKTGEGPLTFDAAMAAMGIGRRTANGYRNHPRARSYFLELCDRLREGEMPRNLHTAIGIRDDDKMALSAAGNRVRIEASRFIEGRDGGVIINNNVGVGVNVTPGYMMDLGAFADAALLRQAGSTRMASSDGTTIDLTVNAEEGKADLGPIVEEPPVVDEPRHGIKPPEPIAFGPRRHDPLPPLDSRHHRPSTA
jgi:hypothetical protein